MIFKLCLRLVVALFLGAKVAALVTSQIIPAGDQPASQEGKAGSRGNRFAESPQILARAILFHGLDYEAEFENTTAEPEAEYVVVGGEG